MYRKTYKINWSHSTLTGQHTHIYGALQVLYRCSESQIVLVSPDQVWYYLYRKRPSKETRSKLIKIFDELPILSKVDGGYYELNTDCFIMKENFVACERDVFEKLKTDPQLLTHYLYIMKCRAYNIEVMGRRNVVCCLPLSYFAEKERVGTKTISSYNKKLEDMKLIYVARSPYSEDRDVNCYSLYEDRDYVDYYMGNYSQQNNAKANFRRKVSAQYNRFKKDPSCYSEKEIKQLKSDVNKYNKEMTELGGDYLKKVKDISIFDLTPTPSSVTV